MKSGDSNGDESYEGSRISGRRFQISDFRLQIRTRCNGPEKLSLRGLRAAFVSLVVNAFYSGSKDAVRESQAFDLKSEISFTARFATG
jgi:hypothetical protein